jgi:hypothetical protein
VLRHTDEAFGAFGLKVEADGVELCAERLDGDAEVDDDEGAEPSAIVAGDVRIHHGGEKNVGDGAGLYAGEGFRADADDLKYFAADVDRTAENAGVVGETAGPVVVGDDGVGAGARSALVVSSEEAAECGLQFEGREHPTGDVLHVALFHFIIRGVGEVGAARNSVGSDISKVESKAPFSQESARDIASKAQPMEALRILPVHYP